MAEIKFDPDLIRELMKKNRDTQDAMARLLKLPSQSAFSNILTGKRRITADEAITLYRYFGLALGDPKPTAQTVPIIGFAAAGRWREAVEVTGDFMTIPSKKAGARSFAVEVEGDSMGRVLEDGSHVVVDPDQKELIAGKIYLLQNGDAEVTIKRYRRDPARFCPDSDNPEHQEFLASDHDFVVLGRAVWQGSPL